MTVDRERERERAIRFEAEKKEAKKWVNGRKGNTGERERKKIKKRSHHFFEERGRRCRARRGVGVSTRFFVRKWGSDKKKVK